MNIKILLIHQMESFPICGGLYIEQMPDLIKGAYKKSAAITTGTLSRFFNHGGLLAIAVNDRMLIGLATLVPSVDMNEASALIRYVAVRPQYEGKEIGREIDRELINELIERAGRLNIRDIDVACDPSNEKAARLFHQLGFKNRDVVYKRLTLKKSVEAEQAIEPAQGTHRID